MAIRNSAENADLQEIFSIETSEEPKQTESKHKRNEKLYTLKDSDYTSIQLLKVVLMFFAGVSLFGVSSSLLGGCIQAASCFAIYGLFLLEGFEFTSEYGDSEKRMTRTIFRTGIFVVIYAAFIFGIEFAFSKITGGYMMLSGLDLTDKIFWIKTLVFHIWPFLMSNTVWYIADLFCVYLIIFLLKKVKLLHFDILIALLLLIVAYWLGEFCAFTNFTLFGYQFIPRSFFTVGLPFALIGSFIRRNYEDFANQNPLLYIFGGLFGILLCFVEYFILGSLGMLTNMTYFIGGAIAAICVSMLAIDIRNPRTFVGKFVASFSKLYLCFVYFMIYPAAMILIYLVNKMNPGFYSVAQSWISVFAMFSCFIVASVIATVIYFIKSIIKNAYNRSYI